jgi:hypothetical protein
LMNMLNRELFKGLNISEQFQPSTWFTSFTPKPCEHLYHFSTISPKGLSSGKAAT